MVYGNAFASVCKRVRTRRWVPRPLPSVREIMAAVYFLLIAKLEVQILHSEAVRISIIVRCCCPTVVEIVKKNNDAKCREIPEAYQFSLEEANGGESDTETIK